MPYKKPSAKIENLYQLSEKIYSGAEPRGEAAFHELRRMGIKTVLSVDGARPDVKAAKQEGLRYVHLPIGYDGVTRERQLQLAKAVQALEGPIYVHCHHGKHRGPAAAAICRLANDEWNVEAALQWMHDAGTSPHYRGLYHAIREYRKPTAEELAKVPKSFPEQAEVPDMVEAMVAIDQHWENLQSLEDSGFLSSAKHPDITAAHEALQIQEQLRELARTTEANERAKSFQQLCKKSEKAAADLHAGLLALRRKRADKSLKNCSQLLQRLRKSCAACHSKHRDGE